MKALTFLFQTTVLILAAMSANLNRPIIAQRSTPIALGEIAPDFTLEDQNGNKISLSDARGKSPVVLVFYRGYW